MLTLKLVRSLVLGDTITDPLLLNHFYHRRRRHQHRRNHRPFLLFLPTQEIVFDACRLANLARDIGMDFSPDPSLSTVVFSWPPLSKTQVSLPFPDLSSAPLSQLRQFLRLSGGFFKLVSCEGPVVEDRRNTHPPHSISLFVRLTGNRVDNFGTFARILAGVGWSFFKCSGGLGDVVHLFRKVERRNARVGAGCCSEGEGNSRIRELRLPDVDFRNAPTMSSIWDEEWSQISVREEEEEEE
ncbi:hypothetical protein H6P81_012915 [Aristolochia fimbriata]|uniref:Uncharacterized protein n=1 Tax=Aristolochia fimbriata TaxID=158543 RepID=A0AAV7EGT1_ARIFI|nr:hypothetical protein H6P81_012915 [Aristolochia fimbriata]